MAAAFVPEAELCEVEGVSLVVGALVAISSGVAVYGYVPRNERTDALDADRRRAFDRWAAETMAAGQRGAESADPPREPIVALFGATRLSLSDDAGTPYRWLLSQMGGSGTEWEATWRFGPAVPESARRLTLAIESEDGRRPACVLSL